MSSGWLNSEHEVLSFGYTASTYWIRFGLTQGFDLTQDRARTLSYLLEIAYPVLDHVDVHVFQDDVRVAHYSMGDRLSYAQRPVDNPNFVVPLEVQPEGTTEIYLRVQSSSSMSGSGASAITVRGLARKFWMMTSWIWPYSA